MKIEKIIEEIEERIIYLENKKGKLDIMEMKASTRQEKKDSYTKEIDRLYNMLRNSK